LGLGPFGSGFRMRRLERLDLWLIATLVPLWLVTLGLHLRAIATTGLAKVSIFVGPPEADGYPTVRGRFVQHGELADVQELRIGDRLLAAGGVDLRGMGHLGFHALVLELGADDLRVPIRFERDGRSGEALLTLVRGRYPWGLVPSLVISGIAALIILVRAQSPRQGRRFFLALMLYLALVANFEGGPRAFSYAWRGFQFLAGTVVPSLVLLWGLHFTEDPPRRSWLAGGWPWLIAPVYAVLRLSYVFGGPVPPAYVSAALGATDGSAAVALLGTLPWNYRRSDAEGRRRIKWVLYGFYVGLVPFAVASNLAPVPGLVAWQSAIYGISMVLTVACILGILVAIVWHHLWDIDRIISGTASYTIVGVLALTCLLTVVPRLAQATSSVVPVDPEVGETAFSILLAAVAVAANRKLRPWIDHVFFPERQALERGLGRLLQEFSACESPQKLFALAGERLDALLRPESCVLYVGEGRAYTPAFARGRAIPTAFATSGSLVAALAAAREPIQAERWSPARGSAGLDALDRAGLQTLGPSIVGPVRRGERLVAFVCLGRKHSGDIYSEADRVATGAARSPRRPRRSCTRRSRWPGRRSRWRPRRAPRRARRPRGARAPRADRGGSPWRGRDASRGSGPPRSRARRQGPPRGRRSA